MSILAAIASEDLSVIKQAISQARDVNEVGPGGTTPLIEAAKRGLLEVVTLLLRAGAEPEWRDEQQETALLKAAANGHPQVAAALAGTASEDDKDLARSFLNAFGASHGPEYRYDPLPLHKKAVEVAARAANFVGHEDPLRRVQRADRAEDLKKK